MTRKLALILATTVGFILMAQISQGACGGNTCRSLDIDPKISKDLKSTMKFMNKDHKRPIKLKGCITTSNRCRRDSDKFELTLDPGKEKGITLPPPMMERVREDSVDFTADFVEAGPLAAENPKPPADDKPKPPAGEKPKPHTEKLIFVAVHLRNSGKVGITIQYVHDHIANLDNNRPQQLEPKEAAVLDAAVDAEGNIAVLVVWIVKATTGPVSRCIMSRTSTGGAKDLTLELSETSGNPPESCF
jgi:hypothetical protein